MIKYIILSIATFIVVNILVWYQLNSQLVWEWAKGYKSMWIMSILGIPISLLFWLCTKWGYLGFGNLWAVRWLAFGSSMIVFPLMTYFYLLRSLYEARRLKSFLPHTKSFIS